MRHLRPLAPEVIVRNWWGRSERIAGLIGWTSIGVTAASLSLIWWCLHAPPAPLPANDQRPGGSWDPPAITSVADAADRNLCPTTVGAPTSQ